MPYINRIYPVFLRSEKGEMAGVIFCIRDTKGRGAPPTGLKIELIY
jgi:hypothetical protein